MSEIKTWWESMREEGATCRANEKPYMLREITELRAALADREGMQLVPVDPTGAGEIERLRALLARQYKADAALYALPWDCRVAEHRAAMEEHDAVHALLAAEFGSLRPIPSPPKAEAVTINGVEVIKPTEVSMSGTTVTVTFHYGMPEDAGKTYQIIKHAVWPDVDNWRKVV